MLNINCYCNKYYFLPSFPLNSMCTLSSSQSQSLSNHTLVPLALGLDTHCRNTFEQISRLMSSVKLPNCCSTGVRHPLHWAPTCSLCSPLTEHRSQWLITNFLPLSVNICRQDLASLILAMLAPGTK